MAKDEDDRVDYRETLKLLTQILDGSREREAQMRRTQERVITALDTMTEAFKEQSEKVGEMVDFRTEFSKLRTAFYESQRQNDQLRGRLEFIGGFIKPAIIGAIGLIVAAILYSAGVGSK